LNDSEEIVIHNEEEAFAAIERAIKHEFGVEPIQIKFESWPQIEIRLEGKGYEGTITADMAGALVELQHAMNRAYARMVHQSTNARSLTDVERGQLQFKAKVENGSSLIKVDLGEYAEKLVVALADKMYCCRGWKYTGLQMVSPTQNGRQKN
jgi:hypothetical protein